MPQDESTEGVGQGEEGSVEVGTGSADDAAVQIAPPTDSTVPAEFISGVAGSGKTFECVRRIEADPSWGLLCATTGIAAVNLGTITINSALGYFDTVSMRDAYLTGQLARKLRGIAQSARTIVVDEVSMMDAEQLTLLYTAVQQYNGSRPHGAPPLGITLVGDFCQLPPVKADFAFRSPVWPEFAAHTTRLTKVWRQADASFLAALNAARAGEGAQSAAILDSLGVEWRSALDITFDGTTLIPRNEQVDRYNAVCLARIPGTPIPVRSRRWGKQDAGWRNVPEVLTLKRGAYVMLLSNRPDINADGTSNGFLYVNGDCGHLVEYDPDGRLAVVRLVRNDDEVAVPHLIRSRGDRSKPESWSARDMIRQDFNEWMSQPHYQRQSRLYCDGQCEYLPMRLAWASTVHKSQGLSLDRIQVDVRDHFFSAPAMCYVALSRARTHGGLRLVGQRERFVKHCKVNPQVKEWL